MLDKYDDESDEVVSYRVPMSIGEGHTELDNKSKACTAYDVIVSCLFVNIQFKIRSSYIFYFNHGFPNFFEKAALKLRKSNDPYQWDFLKNLS